MEPEVSSCAEDLFPQGCLGIWGKFNRCLGTDAASEETEAGQHA